MDLKGEPSIGGFDQDVPDATIRLSFFGIWSHLDRLGRMRWFLHGQGLAHPEADAARNAELKDKSISWGRI